MTTPPVGANGPRRLTLPDGELGAPARGGYSGALLELREEIARCAACPRLVAWREQVARVKVKRFRDCEYWGKAVPGFGDPAARIVVVGLAPGAHGANRTGRMFTGDRSGDFLFAAMHRAGLASQPTSVSRGDGLVLHDAYVLAAARCAPPGNALRPEELTQCARYIDAEIMLLVRARVLIALGAIAWRACLDHASRRGTPIPRPRPPFAHGATLSLGGPTPRVLLGSFHVSQQNTHTGRLTPAMLDAVLAQARASVGQWPSSGQTR
ncbi:MAG: uracil-DNA glycosylase [Myxococcota bacterium]|nr:uracil-DNA glycosylase [Myxococcota bacterium]